MSRVLGGSGGRVYAGPRVRVRRGRTGKFPSFKSGQMVTLVGSWEKAIDVVSSARNR